MANHRSLGKRWSLLGYSTSKKVDPKAGHWERISMYFCWAKEAETPCIWVGGGRRKRGGGEEKGRKEEERRDEGGGGEEGR